MPTFTRAQNGERTLQTEPTQTEAAIQKPKHTLLPLLVALFIVSYGILTMLVVEQGRTIQSQRGLIMDLFNDSNELIHLKGKLAQQQLHAGKPNGKAHMPAAAVPVAPNNQTQAQSAPQAGNKTHSQVSDSASVGKKPAQTEKPPKAQDDDPDMRRIKIST